MRIDILIILGLLSNKVDVTIYVYFYLENDLQYSVCRYCTYFSVKSFFYNFGAIFINETCGDVGHGMEIICGHHWAVVIFKTYPQTL